MDLYFNDKKVKDWDIKIPQKGNIEIKDKVIENLRKKICDFAFTISQLNKTNINDENYKDCPYYKESRKTMTDNIQKLYEITGVDSVGFNTYTLKDEYPPFTAEKQLELIKWLSQNFDIVRFWTEHFEYIAEINGVFDVDKEFNQALAGLILQLWNELSDTQKEEIKEILE